MIHPNQTIDELIAMFKTRIEKSSLRVLFVR